jgi:hypothetical protein
MLLPVGRKAAADDQALLVLRFACGMRYCAFVIDWLSLYQS